MEKIWSCRRKCLVLRFSKFSWNIVRYLSKRKLSIATAPNSSKMHKFFCQNVHLGDFYFLKFFFSSGSCPKIQSTIFFAFIYWTMGCIQKLIVNTFVSHKILPQIPWSKFLFCHKFAMLWAMELRVERMKRLRRVLCENEHRIGG